MMNNSLKTPLKRVRGLGSAKSGTQHFWLQRLTGVAMVPLTIAFVLIIASLARASQATVVATLGSPVVAVLLYLFIITGLVHMRAGMQVIIEDYLPGGMTRILAVICNTLFTFLVGAACFFALLKLNFGI